MHWSIMSLIRYIAIGLFVHLLVSCNFHGHLPVMYLCTYLFEMYFYAWEHNKLHQVYFTICMVASGNLLTYVCFAGVFLCTGT